MAHPYHHAVSSARQFGGWPEDYQAIHDWFDETKKLIADIRHRALRHHAEGIFLCEAIFGTTIALSTCGRCGEAREAHPIEDTGLLVPRSCAKFKPKLIPVRWIGEQHVREDMGFIPTAAQWLANLKVEPWMTRSRKLSRELDALTQKEIDEVADKTGVYL